ncbi:MAG: hypothetical protein AB9M53_04700 [Leptothrix sp. (in: b-proteobacteria)]
MSKPAKQIGNMPAAMTAEQLHAYLTEVFELVPEPVRPADARTYFWRRVEWHPARSTRTLKVFYDAAMQPSRLQLCASSDNNNTVLLRPPFDRSHLEEVLTREVALVQLRLSVQG